MTELRDRWAVVWPPALAAVVVSAVGVPAAVASYRHARAVVEANGDPVMAPWLPLSVDGMLVAALVVIWVRRHRGDPAGWGPWAAFGFGMVVTVAANLAAVSLAAKSIGNLLTAALTQAAPGVTEGPGVAAYLVALFPPLALAITLELVALVAYRTRPVGATGDASTAPVAAVDHPSADRPVDDVEPATAPLPVVATAVAAKWPMAAVEALPVDPVDRSGGEPVISTASPAVESTGTDDVESTTPTGSRPVDADQAPAGDTDQDDDLLKEATTWATGSNPTPGWRKVQAEFPELSQYQARRVATAVKDRPVDRPLRAVAGS